MLRIPYGLSVYDELEINAVIKVLSEHRSNMGKETIEFEKGIAKIFGKRYSVMVNSGSSANFLAIKLLNLAPGSEIITPLLTFSTTIAPLIQHGLVPVFVDVEPGKYTIKVEEIERLITNKTRALMIPLLLGNVPEMDRICEIAKKHKLFFIEDSCDTLGAKFDGKPTGSFSDITTTSFFGSHIITAGGNGGMLMVNSSKWRDKAKVLRGWGRNSSLFGETENITERFKTKIAGTPYDSKFIFDEVGYNFLPNEMGAAFGNIQLEKLGKFRQTRERNFNTLLDFFKNYKHLFTIPQRNSRVKTQWLAFPLTISKNAPFTRIQLIKYLERHNIQTRPIFSGNILKQPGFKDIPHKANPHGYPVADEIMKRGFLVGCHHGLEEKHIDRLKEVFISFFKKFSI